MLLCGSFFLADEKACNFGRKRIIYTRQKLDSMSQETLRLPAEQDSISKYSDGGLKNE